MYVIFADIFLISFSVYRTGGWYTPDGLPGAPTSKPMGDDELEYVIFTNPDQKLNIPPRSASRSG